MIDFLFESKQVTSNNIRLELLEHEVDYKVKLGIYLKEIPPNFLSFYNKGTKRNEVEAHLKKLYNTDSIQGGDIDIVLRRVVNLARVLNSTHRSEYEDKLGQTEYKKKNWNTVERCQICGYKFKNWQETSLEHVLPLSLGGVDNSTNWQLLCKRCNHEKSSLFGIATVNRSHILTDLKIYKFQSIKDQLKKLPENYRYLIFEKYKRKCSLCTSDHTNKELYVSIKNKDELVSFDNLYTLCETCLRSKNIPKTETL